MKQQLKYVCSQCGFESISWLGKCPQCDTWNSLIETLIGEEKEKENRGKAAVFANKLTDIKTEKVSRIVTGLGEFDRVLGGGYIEGSVVLISGNPGIGKSTLLLQLAINLASISQKVLYVSGEESAGQIKLRADRLSKKVKLENLYVLSETNVEAILSACDQISAKLLIVDSIQTMQIGKLASAPGSVSQVKESSYQFHRLAKVKNISVFLIGHVTKDGIIAGPKTVEHLVDVVLYLEGEEYKPTRILASVKNRFGSTWEVGLFEIGDSGLVSLDNPSKVFLQMRVQNTPGSVVTATVAGSRPILAEIQALASPTAFGYPKRVATGIDFGRLEMIIAVLTKKLKLALSSSDIYVNVAGGLKVFEPACDLAIALAIWSSAKYQPVDKRLVAIGEVGLLGELRPVPDLERRLSESKKMGLDFGLTPKNATTLDAAVKIAFK